MASYKKDIPRFDGMNYSLWKARMECHLRCIGEPYWKITKNTYVIPQNSPSTTNEIKEAKNNVRAMEALLSALTNSEMKTVMDLKTTYEI